MSFRRSAKHSFGLGSRLHKTGQRAASPWLTPLLTLALVVTGCTASTPASPTATATASEQPVSGGTLRDAVTGTVGVGLNLLPSLSVSTAGRSEAAVNVYDSLYRHTEQSGLQDWLAEKTAVSADGLTWTLTLRAGVKFHDGTNFDAAAVKTNLDARKAHPTFPLKALIRPLTASTAVDSRTVELRLDKPYAALRLVLSNPLFGMMSPTALAKYPEPDYFKYAAGTGPFKLDGAPTDSLVKLVRNPDYWAGAPHLERVELVSFNDAASIVAALEAGDIHRAEVPSADFNRLKSEGKLKVIVIPSGAFDVVNFNNGKGPTTDKRVREALVYAMNRTSYPGVAPGLAKAAESLAPSSAFGYAPQKLLPYDVEKAKQLLSQAGVQAGTPLRIIARTSGHLPNTAQLVLQDIQRLGTFNASLTILESSAYRATMATIAADSTWHIEIGGASKGPYEDAEAALFQGYYSPNRPPAGRNWSNYRNPQVDVLLEQQQGITDSSARAKALADLQRVILEDIPAYPLLEVANLYAESKSLRSVENSGAQQGVMFHKAWLAK